MADRPKNPGLAQLCQWIAAERDGRLPDADLLARFVADRDEAAFATLVKRHGRMVHGVCQAVLGSAEDAEDACQATFLVLAKKARAIRKQHSVASWLHGVAYRLARKLKASTKRTLKGQPTERQSPSPFDELSWREVRQIVHEELERLPQKYRLPLILCYLEGATQEGAARQLGWTAGMLKGMVTRGRDLLRRRLTRRGLTMTAPLLVGALAPNSAGAILAATTARAVVQHISGQAVGSAISAQALALANGAMGSMMLTKMNAAMLLLLVASVLAVGGGLMAVELRHVDEVAVAPNEDEKGSQVAGPNQRAKETAPPRVDLYGDPLPEGAMARVGTTRFLVPSPGYLYPIAYTPNGKNLVAMDAGKAVVILEMNGKETRRIWGEGKSLFAFHTFVLSPNGKTIATVGSTYPNIVVWDFATGKKVHEITHETLETKEEVEHPASAVFTPDGKVLAVSKSDGIIRRWDTATWQELSPLPKGGCTLQLPQTGVPVYYFLPDGKTLISAWDGKSFGHLTWWDTLTGKQIRQLELDSTARTMAVSPNGQAFATQRCSERTPGRAADC